MSKKITVFTKPNCMQCNFTKKYLDENDISYTTIDVMEHELALRYLTEELGFSSLPVVVVEGTKPFSGFRPDILAKLK